MRLICPNCDAQYNVAFDAIPPGGRDVQCSSCAHTWFQTDKPTVAGRNTSKVLSRPLPAAIKSAPHGVGGYDKPSNSDTSANGKSLNDGPKHRPVDSSVANILREEAAREHEVSDSGAWEPPETEEAKKAAAAKDEETRKRIAQMTQTEGGIRSGISPAQTAAAAAAANPRAVPDINEINAALRARAEANDNSGLNDSEKHEAARRSGFRRGFFFMLLIIAILVLPYVFAAEITENLPQTRDFMEPYVAFVNQLRISVDALFATISLLIERFTGETS